MRSRLRSFSTILIMVIALLLSPDGDACGATEEISPDIEEVCHSYEARQTKAINLPHVPEQRISIVKKTAGTYREILRPDCPVHAGNLQTAYCIFRE